MNKHPDSHANSPKHAPRQGGCYLGRLIGGTLFTPAAMQTLYHLVTTPTPVVYDQNAFVGPDLLPELLRRNPAWRAEHITPTWGRPHFERLDETAQAIERFWAEPE